MLEVTPHESRQPLKDKKKKRKREYKPTETCPFTEYFAPFPETISELTSQLANRKLEAILATFSILDKLVIQYASVSDEFQWFQDESYSILYMS